MALIPILDRNPRLNVDFHYVTIGLIVVNLIVFLYGLDLTGLELTYVAQEFGLRPAALFGYPIAGAEASRVPAWATLVTYQFVHGGVGHFIFNMLYLWVFGDNVEDAMGHLRFLAFYLLCGAVAGLVQALVAPMSAIPVIGASGAVAGALGAYFILHPRARVWSLLFWVIPIPLPALIVLGLFFLQNLMFAVGGSAEQVAVWAHIGGFVAGAALIALFRYPHVPLWHRPPSPWKRRRRR